MLGVWIAPVTAQLMITLPAMLFLPDVAGGAMCTGAAR